MKTKIYFLLAILTLGWYQSNSQVCTNETPISCHHIGNISQNIPTMILPAVNVDSLLIVDSLATLQDTTKDSRFGTPIYTDITPSNSGIWETLPNGDRLWRIKIIAGGAYFTNLIFSQYLLPEGAKLFVYNSIDTLGAFTNFNNKSHGKFAIGPVAGDNFVIEYFEPANVGNTGSLNITKVIYAYKSGFGVSESCHNNANCYTGTPYDDPKRAVASIHRSDGTHCTGTLVNQVVNTEDIQPYFLTAHHCIDGDDVNTWIFIFNYSSPSCSNINGPTFYTVSGATLKANKFTSDFALLLLDEKPPAHYNVFYAGWDKSGTSNVPPSTFGIHHPRGDIKKISFDNNSPISDSRFGIPLLPNSFWQVDDWDSGSTEGGSSGSPLFNDEGRVIGQLLGGFAACDNNKSDWYGKFAWSWGEGNSSDERLRDWLDPHGTDISIMYGFNPCYVDLYVQNVNIAPANAYQPNNELTIRATNNIYVAGSGTTVTVQNGANVNFVSGSSIVFGPGFSTQPGVEMHAYIEQSDCYYIPGFKKANNDSTNTEQFSTKEVNENKSVENNKTTTTKFNIFPNPTTNHVIMQLNVFETIPVTITVKNLNEQTVLILADKKTYQAGAYQVIKDISKLSQGEYFIVIETGSEKITKKIIKVE